MLGKVAGKRKTPRAVTLGVLAFGTGFCFSAEKQKAPGTGLESITGWLTSL
jgi:hypothetical protein